jgi:hypothetical protein
LLLDEIAGEVIWCAAPGGVAAVCPDHRMVLAFWQVMPVRVGRSETRDPCEMRLTLFYTGVIFDSTK